MTTRRRAETQRKLIEAAYDVFSELGIRDAPVEVICERAGFTRGAFYSNFDSKEDLFLAVYREQMQERVDRLRAAVDDAAKSSDDVTQVLQHAGVLFMESLTSDVTWYLLNAEFRVQALRQPELRAPTAAAITRFQDGLADILLGLLDQLDMRLTVEPRSAIATIVAMYEAMLERSLLGEQDSRFVTDVIPRVFSSLVTRET